MQIALMKLVLWTLPVQALAIFQPLAYQIIIDQAVAHGGMATLVVMLTFMAVAWAMESWIQWHRQQLFYSQASPLQQRIQWTTPGHSAWEQDHVRAWVSLGPWGLHTLHALDMGGSLALLLLMFVLHWPIALLASAVWGLTTAFTLSPHTLKRLKPHQISLVWSTVSRMMQWVTLGWGAHETLNGHLSMGSLIAINLLMARVQASWPVTTSVVQSWQRWNWALKQGKQT